MKRVVPALLLALLVAPAAGCDTSEPQDYVPVYDPSNLDPIAQIEFCPLLARESCAILRPCCQQSPYPFDENKCHLIARSLCESRKTRSQNAGLSYDPFMAGRCVHGSAALVRDCTYVTSFDDPDANAVAYACTMVWHGDVARNQLCEAKKLECAPYADRQVSCSGGRCVALKLAGGGDDCTPRTPPSDTVCGPGLVCRELGSESRCTARYHPVLSACSADSECGSATSDVYCDLSPSPTTTAGTCRNLPQDGEPCATIDGRSASDRRCVRGAKCDTDVTTSGVCTLGKPIGATCTDNVDCASGSCYNQQICVPGTLVDPFVCSGALVSGFGGFAPVTAPVAE